MWHKLKKDLFLYSKKRVNRVMGVNGIMRKGHTCFYSFSWLTSIEKNNVFVFITGTWRMDSVFHWVFMFLGLSSTECLCFWGYQIGPYRGLCPNLQFWIKYTKWPCPLMTMANIPIFDYYQIPTMHTSHAILTSHPGFCKPVNFWQYQVFDPEEFI